MPLKFLTLRKISTGGILNCKGRSCSAIIKSKGLDPADWEEVKATSESEDKPYGSNQGDGRLENH